MAYDRVPKQIKTDQKHNPNNMRKHRSINRRSITDILTKDMKKTWTTHRGLIRHYKRERTDETNQGNYKARTKTNKAPGKGKKKNI